MPIGTITCVPSARFAFTRSYIDRLAFTSVLFPQVAAGPDFQFNPAGAPFAHYHIKIRHSFWNWSSNNFTLDYIVEEAYEIDDPDPSIVPVPITITYHPPTSAAGSLLTVGVYTFGAPFTEVSLPSRNVPYWLPDT